MERERSANIVPAPTKHSAAPTISESRCGAAMMATPNSQALPMPRLLSNKP